MSRWFRMYADAIRNPKVISLSDRDFRTWVGLLSVASENDGVIPNAETCKRLLSMRLDHLLSAIQRLSKAGLIDALGDCYEPHNWNKFQYKSDTSTQRVTLHRSRNNPKRVTPPETDTDTDSNTLAKASDVEASSDKVFWDSAKAYLGKSKSGMIGKWARDYGKEETAKAITASQIERAVDPVSYIERVLRGRKVKGAAQPVVGL